MDKPKPDPPEDRPLWIPRGITTGGTVPTPGRRHGLLAAARAWWRRRRSKR